MRNILVVIICLLCPAIYGQKLSILYVDGMVNSVASRPFHPLKAGSAISEKSKILVGKYSQLIYRDDKKFARVKTEGYYTHAQLLNILNSAEADILRHYANFIFSEMFHAEGKNQFDKIAGVARGIPHSPIRDADPPVWITDTLAKFIHTLQITDTSLFSTLEIIPITTKNAGGNEVIDQMLPVTDMIDPSGRIVIRSKQPVIFRVTNESRQPLYFTLFDIQPDELITLLIPAKGAPPGNFKIDPGNAWESPVIRFAPPYGTEVCKLIATGQPLNLATFITACKISMEKTANTRSFKECYAESVQSQYPVSQGLNTDTGRRETIHIYSIAFDIEPR